jgi:hypothetical protein
MVVDVLQQYLQSPNVAQHWQNKIKLGTFLDHRNHYYQFEGDGKIRE